MGQNGSDFGNVFEIEEQEEVRPARFGQIFPIIFSNLGARANGLWRTYYFGQGEAIWSPAKSVYNEVLMSCIPGYWRVHLLVPESIMPVETLFPIWSWSTGWASLIYHLWFRCWSVSVQLHFYTFWEIMTLLCVFNEKEPWTILTSRSQNQLFMVTMKANRFYSVFGINILYHRKLYAPMPFQLKMTKLNEFRVRQPDCQVHTKALHASFWLERIPLAITFYCCSLSKSRW